MIREPRETIGKDDVFSNWKRENINRFNEVIGDIQLTNEEERTILWLCGSEKETIDNMINLFKKLKNN